MDNKIACAMGGYPNGDLDRVMQGLAQAGFQFVEVTAIPSPKSRITAEMMSPEGAKRLLDALASYGLTPVSVSGHSDLTQQTGVDQFKARIDLAAALGVDIVNTGASHGDSKEQDARFFAHMKEALIPYAASNGVRIALETHGGLTGVAEDCLKTLDRLDSERVGINYDPANVLYYRGVRPEVDIAKIAEHVIHVHLKDQRGGQGVADFPLLGEGDIDFEIIVNALNQVGYKGPYSAEIEIHDIADWDAEDEVRKRSRQFMQKLLRSG